MKSREFLSIIVTLLLFVCSTARADPQTVVITGTDATSLIYTVDDGKAFASADACGKHCWNRSSSITPKSKWSNMVRIHFRVDIPGDERQLIGDWFVANCVYPSVIWWVEDGKDKKADYSPDMGNLEKIRKLRG